MNISSLNLFLGVTHARRRGSGCPGVPSSSFPRKIWGKSRDPADLRLRALPILNAGYEFQCKYLTCCQPPPCGPKSPEGCGKVLSREMYSFSALRAEAHSNQSFKMSYIIFKQLTLRIVILNFGSLNLNEFEG